MKRLLFAALLLCGCARKLTTDQVNAAIREYNSQPMTVERMGNAALFESRMQNDPRAPLYNFEPVGNSRAVALPVVSCAKSALGVTTCVGN